MFFFKIWNKFCGEFGGVILFAIYFVFVNVVRYEYKIYWNVI